LLFKAFLASRIVDIFSTVFMLNFKGAIETNPISDPKDISKLLNVHFYHIVYILAFGYFIGLWNPWIGNGFLLMMIMIGFRAWTFQHNTTPEYYSGLL